MPRSRASSSEKRRVLIYFGIVPLANGGTYRPLPFLGSEADVVRSPMVSASRRTATFPVGRAVRFFSLAADAGAAPRLFARDGRYPNARPPASFYVSFFF